MTDSTVLSSSASAKPPRNPVERIIVRGGIGVLVLLALVEFRAKQGYSASLAALNAATENESRETTLADARKLLSLAPSISGPENNNERSEIYTCAWPSLLKRGQFEIKLLVSKDKEQVLLGFTTPNPPEEPAPEVIASTEPPSGYAGGGVGMGGSPGGMGGMMGMGGGGGGAPRPNPIRDAIDTDKDGSLSADEIAAAPTGLAQLDKDADGKVTLEELAPPAPPADPAHAAPAGGPGGGGARRPGRLFTALDSDKDGSLSVEELAAAPTGLKSLDADMDGVISADELRPPGGFGGGMGGAPGGSDRPRRPGAETPPEPKPEAPATGTEPAAPATGTPTPPAPPTPEPPAPAAAPGIDPAAPATGTP